MASKIYSTPRVREFTSAGAVLNGGKLYFYLAGTTTPATVYTSSAMTTAHAHPVLATTAGLFPAIWLSASVTYDVTCKNSANAVQWTVLNYSDALTADEVAPLIFPRTAAEIAAGVMPTNYLYAPGDVRRYGAVGDGVTDDRAAIQTAITVARNSSTSAGARVFIPRGTYRLVGVASSDSVSNGLLIPYTSANSASSRITIVGEGRSTILRAGSTGMVIVRLSDSHCGISDLTIDGNSLANTWGLGIIPESVTQTTTQVHNNFNRGRGLYIINCTEALPMQAGPKVAGADSGCWYNDIQAFIYNCTRGVWMRDPPNAASGANRNTLRGRIGQGVNTGIQIDAGDTNRFVMNLEGITSGTSPNATPTAVKILMTAAVGLLDNNDNIFTDCVLEGNTRDLDNANTATHIIGGVWTATKFGGGGVLPRTMIGGDPSLMPLVMPGLAYGEGVAGYPSGYIGTTKEIADTGYNWQTYTLTTGIMTNVASISSYFSKYTKRGNVVTWQAVFVFQASVAGTTVTITPPIAAEQNMYCAVAASNYWFQTTVIGASAAPVIVASGFNNATPGVVIVPAPAGNWVTASAGNTIWLNVEYHT